MTLGAKTEEGRAKDLIDHVAEALPVEVRSDYYREMRHLRSLPENDEMLRILRAMQFLTLLIHGAPARLAAERELLDNALARCTDALRDTIERLEALPSLVASDISPTAIVAAINESLRQQFVQSTIPQTGQALAVVAAQIKRSVADFQLAASEISGAHGSASKEAQRAVRGIESAIRDTAAAARKAIEELSSTYLHEYRWSVSILCAISMGLGLLIGILWR